MRLIPIAYGLGYVTGRLVALMRSMARGTTLSQEAADLPLLAGLLAAVAYTAFLIDRLLSVS